MTKYKLALTTDGAGAATAITTDPVSGEVCSIYVDLGTLEHTTDVVVTVNDGDGSLPVITLTNVTTGWYYPIISGVHYTGSGTPKTDGYVPVVGYITATVAQGGATKAGAVYIFVEE
jgi:hypothetical protein